MDGRGLGRASSLLAGAVFVTACSGASVAGDDTGIEPLVGEWRGALLSEGGELPFKIRVNPQGSEVPAVVINGAHEAAFVDVRRQGAASYILRFAHDEPSEIVARMSPSGEALSGYWRHHHEDAEHAVELGYKAVTQMPFSAAKNDQRRFQRNDPALQIASPEGMGAVPEVAGTWKTTFLGELEGGEAEFFQEHERVVSTVLGSEPRVEGIYRNGLLRLSLFDGHRALLLHARAQADATLRGDLWIADQARQDWGAHR